MNFSNFFLNLFPDQMPPMNLMKEAIKFCRRWLWVCFIFQNIQRKMDLQKKHWSRPFNEAIKETLPHEMVEQRREEKKSTTGHKMVNALNRFREWRKRVNNREERVEKKLKNTEILFLNLIILSKTNINIVTLFAHRGGSRGVRGDMYLSPMIKKIYRGSGRKNRKLRGKLTHFLKKWV